MTKLSPPESQGAEESHERTFRSTVNHGMFWTGIAQFTRTLIQIMSMCVMARLLSPSDFGLVAMGSTFTGFALAMANFGLAPALVQRKDIEDEHLNAAFWANIVIASFVFGVVCLMAPLIAAFFEERSLILVVRLAATVIVLNALQSVHRAILMRRMRFKAISAIETVGLAAGTASGISLALLSFGPIALVAVMVVASTVSLLASWLILDWLPGIRCSTRHVRELWRFGGGLFGFTVANYWSRKADDFFIGRFQGTTELGYYSRAYGLLLVIIHQVNGVVSGVMFSGLSRISHQPALVKKEYLRLLQSISFITFPICMGFLVTAEPMIHVLYGEGWSRAIPVLRILSIVALFQSIGTTTGLIYTSQGRTDIMLRWGVVSGLVTIAVFAISSPFGIVAVAAAYLVRTLFMSYFNFSIPGQFVGLTYVDVLRSVSPNVACAAAMALLVFLVDRYLNDSSHALRLAVMSMIGCASYYVLAKGFKLESLQRFESVLLPRLRSIMA